MRFINSLLILLLLQPIYSQEKLSAPAATTSPNKVRGLTVPASIVVTASDVSKKIVPVLDAGCLDVKFKVISSGDTDPSYRVKGTGKDSYIEIDVPKDKEAYLVFTYALYSGNPPWMTEAAQTIVEWGSGLPPPTTQPPTTTPPTTTPPTTVPPGTPVASVDDVFKNVRNISAILILDMQTANAEVAAITQSETLLKKHFVQPWTNNQWFQYDIRAAQLKQSRIIKTDAQGKLVDGPLVDAQGKVKFPLPVVVLIDGSKQPAVMIGQPQPVQLTGNANNTITNMLNAIAQALKR